MAVTKVAMVGANGFLEIQVSGEAGSHEWRVHASSGDYSCCHVSSRDPVASLLVGIRRQKRLMTNTIKVGPKLRMPRIDG